MGDPLLQLKSRVVADEAQIDESGHSIQFGAAGAASAWMIGGGGLGVSSVQNEPSGPCRHGAYGSGGMRKGCRFTPGYRPGASGTDGGRTAESDASAPARSAADARPMSSLGSSTLDRHAVPTSASVAPTKMETRLTIESSRAECGSMIHRGRRR